MRPNIRPRSFCPAARLAAVTILVALIPSTPAPTAQVTPETLHAAIAALAERPDLILMDVMMPKMDGFEACRRIRELAEIQETPIIMVTTRGEIESMESGYVSGCSEYVIKPIHGRELLEKVKDYLGE